MNNKSIKKEYFLQSNTHVLCIGGLDPSGGAGITADILSLSRFGVRAFSVPTALTVQNDREVSGVLPLDPDFFRAQAEAILKFMPVQTIKVGMVYNEAIFHTLLSIIKEFSVQVVWDPVMDSSSGHSLMSEYIRENFSKALPHITILTPNIPEAEKLTKKTIRTSKDMVQAAQTLSNMGCKCILIKGGHLEGEIRDLLYYMGKAIFFKKTRKDMGKGVKGTGCALSSAISAHIARGFSIVESVEKSVQWLDKELDRAKGVTTDGCSFLSIKG